ncbi:response regulator transcription factor [Sunxiuqinia sp. A32]|uniref:response regulator transcription factor n=1 Tax=Sunxiuqinia sp. A32 TaxID=3461496 RepID=UPI004045F7C0
MKKIIVAEDNKLILETINHKLQKDGYDVIKVLNGKDCLEYLQDNDVDLLITDLYMPFVNGHEVINTVRNEWNKNTPILVLSADGAEDTVLKAFELGADDYVVKPFSLSELTIRIRKLLST